MSGLVIDAAPVVLFALVLVRVTALVFFTPLFGPSGGISRIKVGAALALSVVMTPPLIGHGPVPASGGALVLLAGKEAALGFLLAFVVSLFLSVARGAGELVSLEMGLGIAVTADPDRGSQSPLLGASFEIIAILLLFAIDGHHLVLRALKLGFDAYPPGSLDMPGGAVAFVTKLFFVVSRSAITLAAPILLVLLATTIGLGIVMKAVPRVHILDFGFPIRVLVAVLLVVLFLPFVGPALVRLFEVVVSGVAGALGG